MAHTIKAIAILFVSGVAVITAGCRNQQARPVNRTICRRIARLRGPVGNLAVDSRSGQREAGAGKCGTKYNLDYRS